MRKYVSFFSAGPGMGAVIASTEGICRVILPGDTLATVSVHGPENPSKLTEEAAEMLQQYFKGTPQPFENIPVDCQVSGAFRTRVLHLIRSIPFGQVRSYGQVALLAGAPSASRAVGGAMAANPVPVIIPCHRVISSSGGLTGFSAPGGVVTKKQLLLMEGIEFKGEKIILKKDDINR